MVFLSATTQISKASSHKREITDFIYIMCKDWRLKKKMFIFILLSEKATIKYPTETLLYDLVKCYKVILHHPTIRYRFNQLFFAFNYETISMRFLLKVTGNPEVFNAYVKDGSAANRMQAIINEAKP
jgi:hypothetical protein